MYRQGDVLLRRTDHVPEGVRTVPRDAQGRIVLAHGEKTGHAHVIDVVAAAETILLETETGERYLTVDDGPVDLVHEEHATISVPPGSYAVHQQREYVPSAVPISRAWSD